MIQALIRFVVGGAIVAVIPLVSQILGPRIAGVVLLFPAVSFVGFLFLGLERGLAEVSSIALSSMFAIPTVMAFLSATWFTASRGFALPVVLVLGLVAWLIVAIVFVLILTRGFL